MGGEGEAEVVYKNVEVYREEKEKTAYSWSRSTVLLVGEEEAAWRQEKKR